MRRTSLVLRRAGFTKHSGVSLRGRASAVANPSANPVAASLAMPRGPR